MGYDSLYRKTHDRQAAIKKLKKIDIITLIIFIILFPAGVYLIHFLISLIFKSSVNYFSVIIISVLSVALIIFDFVKKIKSNYRYVHCSHDIKAIIKGFEAERVTDKKTALDNSYGGSFNEGKLFKYTYVNDARLNCDFDNGVYTFTVCNDEWDEVTKFAAEREEDFEETMLKALEFTASLEKKPEGEYDETLEPEVEIDEYEEDYEEDDFEDDGDEEEPEDKEEN